MTQMAQIGSGKDTVRDQETYAIIGAAMEVHSTLGSGFLEAVYQQALSLELTKQGIPHSREAQIPIFYKETELDLHYRADFLCYDSIIVELKALKHISEVEEAQTINYLHASGLKRALLLNFGELRLNYKRFANDKPFTSP